MTKRRVSLKKIAPGLLCAAVALAATGCDRGEASSNQRVRKLLIENQGAAASSEGAAPGYSELQQLATEVQSAMAKANVKAALAQTDYAAAVALLPKIVEQEARTLQ